MNTTYSVRREAEKVSARIARLEDRYRNELMDEEERDRLRCRILKIKAGAR